MVTFLLGIPKNEETQKRIETESSLHGDILQESFVESYANLTLKSAFILKWASCQLCVANCK